MAITLVVSSPTSRPKITDLISVAVVVALTLSLSSNRLSQSLALNWGGKAFGFERMSQSPESRLFETVVIGFQRSSSQTESTSSFSASQIVAFDIEGVSLKQMKKQSLFKSKLKRQEPAAHSENSPFPQSFQVSVQEPVSQPEAQPLDSKRHWTSPSQYQTQPDLRIQQILKMKEADVYLSDPLTLGQGLGRLLELRTEILVPYSERIESALASSSRTVLSNAAVLISRLFQAKLYFPKQLKLIHRVVQSNKIEDCSKLIRMLLAAAYKQFKFASRLKELTTWEWEEAEYQTLVLRLVQEGVPLSEANFRNLQVLEVEGRIFLLSPLSSRHLDIEKAVQLIEVCSRQIGELQQRVRRRVDQTALNLMTHYEFRMVLPLDSEVSLVPKFSAMVIAGVLNLGSEDCPRHLSPWLILTAPRLVQDYRAPPSRLLPAAPHYRFIKLVELFLTDLVYDMDQSQLLGYVLFCAKAVERVSLSQEAVKQLFDKFVGGFGTLPFVVLFLWVFYLTPNSRAFIAEEKFARYSTLYSLTVGLEHLPPPFSAKEQRQFLEQTLDHLRLSPDSPFSEWLKSSLK